ncbi:ribulose-phosphate 3-epimerase [Brevibacillus daliensis]|uniref:ribulose-phosphate 3-epimerase n=1 Tax=Brevibacillus daliensis TaxID=2892995 RepID=UPI001E62BA72|nr:ribulose-phosphate 3-epimerase [Brevibacillus daliensis]
MSVVISPSLLAADIGNLSEELALLDQYGIPVLHIDIMDGHFVPNMSFGPDQIKMMRSLCKAEFDVHMMVQEPDRYIPAFVDAGADRITIHVEATTHVHRSLQLIASYGKKIGIALNPGTPVDMCKHVLGMVDIVLVMSVNPGFGGQKSITDMLGKIEELAQLKEQHGYSYTIQVDGGINQSNIASFVEAGAEDIVMGSAIFQKGRTEENMKAFENWLKS